MNTKQELRPSFDTVLREAGYVRNFSMDGSRGSYFIMSYRPSAAAVRKGLIKSNRRVEIHANYERWGLNGQKRLPTVEVRAYSGLLIACKTRDETKNLDKLRRALGEL